jgi:DNA-binding LacI/PurR family transcriptional regulator
MKRDKKTVTIRDVAREAGVSPGTVSRAINGSPLVNEKTRQRIMQVVRELNYTPNIVARRLSLGKTQTLAVIVPFFTRPSVSERLNGVISQIASTPYDLLIHNIQTPAQRDAGFSNMLRADRVDGALIVSLPIRESEEVQLRQADVPVVLIDTGDDVPDDFHKVLVDDVTGGRRATEYLLSQGHERIGFVGDRVDNPFDFVSSYNRYRGYCQALEAAGLTIHDAYYGQGEHGRVPARKVASNMLKLAEAPTAILAASDTQAVGVLEAAWDLDLDVPDDLSVVGYDDIELAEVMDLTTVRQPLFESGRLGAELLFATLEDPQKEPVHRLLATELVVRGTVSPL